MARGRKSFGAGSSAGRGSAGTGRGGGGRGSRFAGGDPGSRRHRPAGRGSRPGSADSTGGSERRDGRERGSLQREPSTDGRPDDPVLYDESAQFLPEHSRAGTAVRSGE